MDYWQNLRAAYGQDTLILTGASAAIIRDDKILLVRNKDYGQWQTPGGLQEIGESIQQTLEREIKEELNLEMKATRLISLYSHPQWTAAYPNGDRIQPLNLLFLMEGDISTLSIQESEICEARFFAPEDIPQDTLGFAQQQVIDWVQYRGEVIFR
ncbi:MAG: NUDIX domain-containing protein [Anaerolineales bacterium]|nr:NUDIX domain-containing protein [Anaerolineales bacterium]